MPFIIACNSEHSAQPEDFLEASIDSVILSHQKAFEVPGIAVGILQDNEVIYAKGFGVQAINTQHPVSVRSLFHMASVSKPFVATAIMQLVEAGKVGLDEKLVDYLPYFTMGDDQYRNITIRQMLNHSSGIPDVKDYEWATLNLNSGEINGKRIYSKTSYVQLTTGQVKTGRQDSFCISWISGYFDDLQILSHSGGDLGYRTYFAFVPGKKTAVVLMGNSDFFQSWDAAHQILNKVLLHEPVQQVKKPIHFELKKYILTDGIEKCKAVYFEKKENHPEQYTFKGWTLDNLGYSLLDHNHHQEALDIFLFNVDLTPEESGFYDSVADAYRAMGDKALAIE